ncbi:hypothetical protein HOG21_00305 [bacterium]|jgi:hypothetical protein|nr:hypothetical protein [bacterium]
MWSWSIKKMIIKIKETVDNILPIYHKIHNKKIINELDIAIKIAENHVELKSNNNCEECEKDCDTKKIM